MFGIRIIIMPELINNIVEVTGHNHDGVGTSTINNKKVLIPGSLIGETIKLKIIKNNAHQISAEIDEILTVSAQRQTPECPHYGVCGGCQLQHMSYAYQLALKQKIAEETLASVAAQQPQMWLEPMPSNPTHYRRKARLSAKYVEKNKSIVVGFREQKSHFVTNSEVCMTLEKPMHRMPNQLMGIFNKLSIKNKIPKVELARGDEALSAIIRVLDYPTVRDIDTMKEEFSSLGINASLLLNTKESLPLTHFKELYYSVDGVTIKFLPQDFIQVNSYINQFIIDKVIGYIRRYNSVQVLDLFSGLGNISLPVAKHVERILGVDVDFGLIARAKENAKNNNMMNLKFSVADLFKGRYPFFNNSWDTLIVDPPRSGAENVIQQIQLIDPNLIIYISCNPGTFARDARTLINYSGYTLVESQVADMFPMTNHIEMISIFEKR